MKRILIAALIATTVAIGAALPFAMTAPKCPLNISASAPAMDVNKGCSNKSCGCPICTCDNCKCIHSTK